MKKGISTQRNPNEDLRIMSTPLERFLTYNLGSMIAVFGGITLKNSISG